MGTKNQSRVHKRLADYALRLKLLESVLSITLWSAFVASVAGFLVTLFADQIRARPFELEWLQVAGIAIFFAATLVCIVTIGLLKKKK